MDGDSNNGHVWQDREVRFDVPFAQLKPRKGEVEVDSINAVEDTKGFVSGVSGRYVCFLLT